MSRRASKRKHRKSVRVELLESRRLLSSSGGSALHDVLAFIDSIGASTGWYVPGDSAQTTDTSGKIDTVKEDNADERGDDNNGSEPDDVEQNPVDDLSEPTGNSGGTGDDSGDVIDIVDLPDAPPFSELPVTDPTTPVMDPVDTTGEAPIGTIIDTPIGTIIDTPTDLPTDVLIPTDDPAVTTGEPVIDPIDFIDPTEHVEESIVEIEPQQPILSDPIDVTAPIDVADPVVTDDPVDTTTTPVETVTPVTPEPVAQLLTDHSDDNKGSGKDKSDKGDKGNHGSNHNIKPAKQSNDIDTTATNNRGNNGSNGNSGSSGNSGGENTTPTQTVTSPQAPPTETAPTATTVVVAPAQTTEPAATPAAQTEQAAAKESTTPQQTSSQQAETASATPVATPQVQAGQPAASSAAATTPEAIVDAAAATAAPVGGGGTILSAEQADQQAQEAKSPMLKAVWTFAIEQPLQRVRVVRAQAAAASLAASTLSVDPILKVVHELTMVPPSFALPGGGEGEAGATSPAALGQLTAGQAQLVAAMSQASSLSRNIILALAAGSAVLAVQWYRARQKKLADQAMKLAALMQFDPLAVWLDDPETRQN